MKKRYSIGIDFGTLSARAILLDMETSYVCQKDSLFIYPHGILQTVGGRLLPSEYALQDPSDYLEALAFLLRDVTKQNGVNPEEVGSIGIDTTSCTILPVDASGIPLAFDIRFRNEPQAYVKLWKHHGGEPYVERIIEAALKTGETFLSRCGTKLSCEMMIPKLLETLTEAPHIYEAADRFLHLGDFLVRTMTGHEVHSMSFAVIKEGYDLVDGFASEDFWGSLDIRMKHIIGTKICAKTDMPGSIAGTLTPEWSARTGLSENTAVAVAVIDAHAPFYVAGMEDGLLLMALGTSAGLCMNTSVYRPISGVMSCGIGAVFPNMMTYDAGLACVGDLFDWFVKNGIPATYEKAAKEAGMNIYAYLRELAQKKSPGESGLLALDWWNGNRCILANNHLSGVMIGMTLATRPEDIYRALIEATAYSTRRVLENYLENQIPITKIVATGGISAKDSMLMQIYSDVLNRPLEVLESAQPTAIGSAILGSVAGGFYPDLFNASHALHGNISRTYFPNKHNVKIYDTLYRKFLTLHNYFGCMENILEELSY